MKKIDENKQEILEIKDNKDVINNNNYNNEISYDKIATEETLIISNNKSQSLENNSNSKKTSSPLIEDNIYINEKLEDDHYILIERTKLFNIPYFTFGFTIHFYLPSQKLQMKMKLSEIPNPPFTLGPECK